MRTEPMGHLRWTARAARARRLTTERPAVAETLRFYASLAEAQGTLLERYPRAIDARTTAPADRLVLWLIAGMTGEFIDSIARHAPAALGDALAALRVTTEERWRQLLESRWLRGDDESATVGEVQAFVVEALLQPFAEEAAAVSPNRIESSQSDRCPGCTGLPVVALLREEGHGARRSLVCGLCLTEWPALRVMCVACGESRFESLPVFRADEFDSVRLDACDKCNTYIKAIDLTHDGEALPIPDDLASLPMDLWARDRGYRRVRPNVLRI